MNANYDADDDRIYVSFLAMNSEPNADQMAEGCRNAMAQMNIWLLKSLPSLFLHVGHDDPSRPADLSSDLRELIGIRCYFSSGRSTAEGRFWAHRKLSPPGDDQMIIGKWDMKK